MVAKSNLSLVMLKSLRSDTARVHDIHKVHDVTDHLEIMRLRLQSTVTTRLGKMYLIPKRNMPGSHTVTLTTKARHARVQIHLFRMIRACYRNGVGDGAKRRRLPHAKTSL